MSITNSYFLTKMQGCGILNDTADFLLAPLSAFYQGRAYHIIYNEEKVIISAFKQETVATRARKIQIFILTITLFPILVGCALKWLALKQSSLQEALTYVSAHKEPLICEDTLHLAPQNVDEIDFKSLQQQRYQPEELQELANIWVNLIETEAPETSDKQELYAKQYQLLALISDAFSPEQFLFLPSFQQEEAAKKLQIYLYLILQEVKDDKMPSSKKFATLKELTKLASLCPPTWVEGTAKMYREIKGLTSARETLLRYVQAVKEEIILRKVQQTEDWNELNNVRADLGAEWGLDQTNMRFDALARQSGKRNLNLSQWRTYLQQNYTRDCLINGVESAINRQDYDSALAIELAKIEKLRTDDPHKAVLENYYEENGTSINSRGVELLLQDIGLLI